eukprot:NODE_2810_length_1488_cov_56.999267_g2429_i0.p1 GENE.NODE_2810_length_1488_cov_56.999267_g2429_i0~~NODE_2810_length_1488_cov_56.999267_g2429_i0.p1  ORF type:complete len:479 (+),score=81.44 NODE_2810_length_1488_cov_56.999267_g2429_i0:104-1438(+)
MLATPHHVMFHPIQRTYTVITTTPRPYKPRASELVNPDDLEAKEDLQNRLKMYHSTAVPHATQDHYIIKLYTAGTWELLDSIELDENEAVVSAKTVQLSKEDRSQQYGNDDDELNLRLRKGSETTTLQCVGSGFIVPEDLPCRGRLLLLEVFPNISSKKGDRKLLKLYHDNTKGPVTAICSLNGYLVVAVSSKIMIYFYDWSTKRLIIASFFDAQFYITSLSSIKNCLAYGDAFKSTYFLRWREETRQLTFLGKDFNPCQVASTSFVYEGPQLGILFSDSNNNITVLSYSPAVEESSGGLILLPVADMNVGSLIPCFVSLRAANQTRSLDKSVSVFGMLNGSIGVILAIDDGSYRRLHRLSVRMHTEIPHSAGLHPKSHRIYQGERKLRFRSKYRSPNIIDGDLVLKFAEQNTVTQQNLVTKIGTRLEAIFTILMNINREIPIV